MWITKKTQYGGYVGGYVVMFLPNKIIKNKNLNYPQKNVGLAHGFKTMCNLWFYIHGLGGQNILI